MTDELEWIPAEPEAAISVAKPRRHRHVYEWFPLPLDPELPNTVTTECRCACGAIQDPAASRRGRTVRSYGNRAELAVAREYGGRKVGHAQGPTDVVGKTTKTQVKTRRSAPPRMWRDEFTKLDTERDGRLARLLIRFVRPGHAPEDYIVVRGKDWLDWYGKDDDDAQD